MAAFPDTIQFQGLNVPLRVEWEARDLEVEGEIPADIQGAFYRAVPDPAHPPLFADDHVLSGDGMVSKFLFEGGQVDHAVRYVRTARYEAERKARRALFGKYRNPYTDRPEAAGLDRTVANTTPVYHAGRLFMTKEDGRAYEVNPHTLETIGRWDFHGALRSETMTAHVRIDPATGEMFFFGYEAGGLCSRDVAYCVADKDGNLVSEQWFEAPYCALMHDFVVTERHAIFPVFPTKADRARIEAGGDHWAHDPEGESFVGVMPRYGKVEEMRWFKGPKGVFSFHMLNAFDEGGKVHMDLCLSDTNPFPFIREAAGIHLMPWKVNGGLVRWTMDLERNSDGIDAHPIGPPGDLPRIADADQGRPYRRGWYLSMNPEAEGPPLVGGPIGGTMNLLLRVDPEAGPAGALAAPPGVALHEPVHVSSNTPGHGGWLLLTVDIAKGEDFASELWIVEADALEKGPVAKVKSPMRLKPQVHGWWVPAAQLAQAKARAG